MVCKKDEDALFWIVSLEHREVKISLYHQSVFIYDPENVAQVPIIVSNTLVLNNKLHFGW